MFQRVKNLNILSFARYGETRAIREKVARDWHGRQRPTVTFVASRRRKRLVVFQI